MFYHTVRSALFKLDPELSHDLSMNSLKLLTRGPVASVMRSRVPSVPTRVWGIDFANPVGLAAGLDKHADYLGAMDALGFGFVEVGTVTPQPQPGNPKPRLFRLPEQRAIINRFGFNSKGLEHLVANVRAANRHAVLGINIGKNKATPNEQALDDYLQGLRAVYAWADYVTVNISSPNTPGLRDLQKADSLKALVAPLVEEGDKLTQQSGRKVPLAVKIAPDLNDGELDMMASVFVESGVDGLIATNTTLDRQAVAHSPHANEAGGLSGAPLTEHANQVLKVLRRSVGASLPIIGVGGIMSGDDAVERIRSGADLVQLYSGFIYRGPRLISECAQSIRDSGLLERAP
ncbi:dihydroorotate oxidase [gamma proteobacterium HTCC5015]|nr:dihydroorotate oxidase [gamma proteobacterium HTCC5015]